MELVAFGMPGRMLATGRVDEDGYLRENPSEPAWNLLHVRGPLDLRRLAAAIDLVTRSTDALHLRLRNTDRGPMMVSGKAHRFVLEVLDTDSPVRDGQLAPEVAGKLAPLLFGKIDLRDQPTGRICLVHGDHDEHLLALSFDHTVLDGWSLGLLTRAIAQCYRSGGYEPRGRGFRDFVLSQPPREIQDASLAAWQALLAEHPIPGPPLRFPGGQTKAPDAFRIDGYYDATFPPSVAGNLTAAVTHTGLSRAELLTAATGLAVGMWSDGPQPMLSVRHGHTKPEDILVIGPLVESYVVLPPRTEQDTVAGWLLEHGAANRDTPPLHGRTIREVAPLAPRNAALNVVPPARPLRFGPSTKAVTAPRDLLAPLWTDDRPVVPSTAAFWINFFLDQPGRIEVSITHDRDVLPEPQVLAEAVRAVVTAAGQAPETRLDVLRAQLRG
jgi:hypothetical protein